MKVIKRDGRKVEYNSDKIVIAISNANKEVGGKDKISRSSIEFITKYIESLERPTMSVEEIQDIIERKLMEFGKFTLAKKYILYRDKHALIRQANSTDESILSLVKNNNSEIYLNKKVILVSAQRDLIAGECSKDLVDRVILPERIVKAHKDGIIYFHDRDYFVNQMHDSTCVNIEDMLDNGTVINDKLIESPKSFQVACIVMSQVISTILASQYGAQSLDLRCLGKYLRKTYDKTFKKRYDRYIQKGYPENEARQVAHEDAEERKYEELCSGVQALYYQVNTLMTTTGKKPIISFFMFLDDNDEYVNENALIIEEILKQQIVGMKNEIGENVKLETPNLIYVLDENNSLKGGKYDYITRLAIECLSKNNSPSFISAKKMREKNLCNVQCPIGKMYFCNNENNIGKFNQASVTINLPQIGIIANGDEDKFWKLLDERLEICKDALLCKYNSLLGTLSDVAPILWQYGGIARLAKGEKIDKLLEKESSMLSLCYIGLYETSKLMKKVNYTETDGKIFSKRILEHINAYIEKVRNETNLGFCLCSSLDSKVGYKLAKIDKSRFGEIEDITDKGYYTDSFSIDFREDANIFDKLKFESEFQEKTLGGSISYVKLPNNFEILLEDIIKYAYENVQYIEFIDYQNK